MASYAKLRGQTREAVPGSPTTRQAPRAALAAPHTPGTSRRCGPYILIDRLCASDRAELFRATTADLVIPRCTVVIKRLTPKLETNATALEALAKEATLARVLAHPHVVRTDPIDTDHQSSFIAMEYIEGRDLAALLRQLGGAPLPVDAAAEIARQIAHALAHAHGHRGPDGRPDGIEHGDIRPGHIVISYLAEAKLIDFSSGRRVGDAHAPDELPLPMPLDPGYMAPELIEGVAASPASDVFALGVVLHEALTGQRLFAGPTPMHTMKLVNDMALSPPSDLNSSVPPELDALVLKALNRNPHRRCTAAEMARMLEGFLAKRPHARNDLARLMQTWFAEVAARDRQVLAQWTDAAAGSARGLLGRVGQPMRLVGLALLAAIAGALCMMALDRSAPHVIRIAPTAIRPIIVPMPATEQQKAVK